MSEHGNVPCAYPGTPGRLEMLLGLDIYKVDLSNLFEFPEGRIQQVDTINEEDLVLEEDEDDGLLVDVMGPTESMDQIEKRMNLATRFKATPFSSRCLCSVSKGEICAFKKKMERRQHLGFLMCLKIQLISYSLSNSHQASLSWTG